MANIPRKIIQTNKKAYFEFTIIEKYDVGIVLTGTEIKSIRAGGLNLKDSFARIEKGEMFLYNCHISPFEHGNRYNHEPDRVRKLLLTKKEILKILGKIKQENYAILPLEMYLDRGFAKLEIGLGRGKKLHDKREYIKKKDIQRHLENY